MTLRVLVLSTLCSLAFPSVAWAGEPVPLTWAKALGVAEERAPDVVVAVARQDVSEAGVKVAGRLPDPTFTLGTTTNSYRMLAYFYVSLPLFGQTVSAAGAARAEAAVTEAGVDVARLDARLAAGLAWIDLWERQREAALAQATLTRRERLLQAATDRRSMGAGTDLDVWRADAARARAGSDASALVDEVRASAAQLALLLGAANSGVGLQAAGALPDAVVPATDEALNDLIDTHPVVQRGEAVLGARHAAVKRERFSLVPHLGVELQGSFLPRGARSATNTQGLQATVALKVPLFSAPLIREAVVRERSAQVSLDAMVGALADRLWGARATYGAAATRQQVQQDKVLPLAERAHQASAASFAAGGLDLTSALATEQELTDAKLAAMRAAADLARARARLEHAAGRSL